MIKKITTIFLLFVSVSCLFAQEDKDKLKKENESKIKKANDLYGKYAYIDAIKIYERIASQGYVDQTILENLGNSYYFNADYTTALKWYDQLFENAEKDPENYKITPEYYYRYGQTLKSVERYEDAQKVLDQFIKITGKADLRAKKLEEHTDYLETIKDNSGRLTLTPVDINTEYSEYGTAFYGKGEVVYTASRKPKSSKGTSNWTGEGYYDLYKGDFSEGNLTKEQNFSPVLNSLLNESSPVFTRSLDTIYFTRNYQVPQSKEEKRKKAEEKVLLEIYRSVRSGLNWSEPVRLPFNVTGYSVAHPALSPDGKYLYFAADINGTRGKSDIFRVRVNHKKGTYGKPENLGEIINTEGRETFPFISSENVLFFASDGLPGLGGLDIFAVKIEADGSLKRLQNIGRPGNTPDDDFAFILDEQRSVGFLSSNRPGGKGKDDIYYFIQKRPLEFDCKKTIKGIVRDIDTKKILTNVALTLSSAEQKEIDKITNGADGTFDFGKKTVSCDDTFVFLRAQCENYAVVEEQVSIREKGNVIEKEILMKTTKKPLKKGDDLAKIFQIKEIKFDLGKYNIRPDAAAELAKIVEAMKDHPTMKISIRSHTDSRGSDKSNLILSDKRAKSTMNWIVSQGIAKNRLTAKGYGETRLVNGCKNGVHCTEEEHQQNRRSEFIITQM